MKRNTYVAIYAFAGDLTRLVKVGYTSGRSPQVRLRVIQAMSPDQLRVIGWHARGSRVTEALLHAALCDEHRHGEWFGPRVYEEILASPSFDHWVEVTVERVPNVVECGTRAGYQRHLRRLEHPCAVCRAAISKHRRNLRRHLR